MSLQDQKRKIQVATILPAARVSLLVGEQSDRRSKLQESLKRPQRYIACSRRYLPIDGNLQVRYPGLDQHCKVSTHASIQPQEGRLSPHELPGRYDRSQLTDAIALRGKINVQCTLSAEYEKPLCTNGTSKSNHAGGLVLQC